MKTYSFSELLKSRGNRTRARYFPLINEAPGTRYSYSRILNTLLNKIRINTNKIIVTNYQVDGDVITDVSMGDFERLKRSIDGLKVSVFEDIGNLISRDTSRHTNTFMRSARRVFGVDLRGIINQEQLNDFIEQAAMRNAALVTGMTDDLIKRIQLAVVDARLNGRPVKTLQTQLNKEFDISRERAKLIAQDQTAKINADLNEIRHTQANINKYVWRTSKDERVRERHRKLDGKIYEYGKPTGAEEGRGPGKPIRCRCIGQGLVEV